MIMPLSAFRDLGRRGLDLLLPPRCIVTRQIVDRDGAVAPSAWATLTFIAAPFCESCALPFAFDAGDDGETLLCGACIADPPAFSRTRAALLYDDSSRDMILRFKHGDQTHAVTTFAPWLARAGQHVLEGADMIVPVPLHRWRLLARRYNQAALLAAAVAKRTGLVHLPDALIRNRATPSQGHRKAVERKANLRGAIKVHPRHAVGLKGKVIVLVDDVMTTGATANECGRILKRAGAADVRVLALARVPLASVG